MEQTLSGLAGLAFVAFPGWPTEARGITMSTPVGPAIRETTDSFTSSGHPVRAERFESMAGLSAPPLLLLHGADGLKKWGASLRELARGLALDGYSCLLIHYFDSSGGMSGFDTIPLHFPTWMRAVTDAIAFATPTAGQRVGLVGFSLGAYLSLAVASRDRRVGVVVDCFGGLPEVLAGELTELPPVLILHGEADRVVPVGEARRLEALLLQRGLPFEAHYYPGQGHVFTGNALADAARRSRAFLREHLPPTER